MAFGRYHILCMQVQLHTHVAFFAWYCNACHAALQRGSLAWLFLLPATRGLAMAVIKPHGSSFSFDVRVIHCIHMCTLLTFCVLPTQDGFNCECFAEASSVEEDFSF